MKFQLTALTLLTLSLTIVAAPASAQTIYSNGAINGNTDAYTINFGFAVSDTFPVLGGGATITGLSFGAWLFPGDVLESVEVSITSNELGGTSFFDQTVNFIQSGCVTNSLGFDVCTASGVFDVTLPAGTYWLNLQNAVVNDGDPIYWDENSGPSQASESSVGTIPSESFTLFGPSGSSTTSTSSGSTPEPASVMLLGSGLLALTGAVRRKLF